VRGFGDREVPLDVDPKKPGNVVEGGGVGAVKTTELGDIPGIPVARRKPGRRRLQGLAGFKKRDQAQLLPADEMLERGFERSALRQGARPSRRCGPASC
jgi:hypothetical protein